MSVSRKLIPAVCIGCIAAPAIAAPVTYKIDSDHTYPSLEFSHMGLSVWRGKFNRTKGTVTLDREKKTGTVDVVVDIDSIDFGLDSMHKKAVSDDFFHAGRYPKGTYKGTIQFEGDTPKSVDGQLTLLGVTHPVKLTIKSFKCMPEFMDKTQERCGVDAVGETNWSTYGMKASKWGEGEAGRTTLRIQAEGLAPKK